MESIEERFPRKFEMAQEILYWLLILAAIFIATIGFFYLMAAVALNIIFYALIEEAFLKYFQYYFCNLVHDVYDDFDF